MTLEQLRAFVAVIEHGSIRAGARSLGMAQSGLTQQIKRLEIAVGAQLFVRGHSGVSLTSFGTSLLSRARVILSECSHAEEDFRHLRGELSGVVRVGTSVEAFVKLIPPVLEQLRVTHPNIKVHFASGPSSTLLSGIREGRLDFAISLISQGTDMSDLQWKKLNQADPCILCRKGHPLESADSISALADAKWVNTRALGSAGTPGNRLADWFAMNQISEPQLVATVDSLFDTLYLVSQSDYLFLAPRVVNEIGGFQDLLSVIPVQEGLPTADICLIQPKQTPLSPAASELSSMLVSYSRMY